MNYKNKFLRQCVSCRKICKKENLIRVTKNFKTNDIEINLNNEYFGRSVYICKNSECIENAIKKKKIEKSLKLKCPENLKELLYTVLKK